MSTRSPATNVFVEVRAASSSPPLRVDLACYSLPYGALGFISHLLTYYTITCLCAGRRPLWPFRKIKASKLDIILGSISLCVTTTVAIVTMVRCRHSWQLITIGVWKLGMSWFNTLSGLTTGIIALREEKKRKKEDEEKSGRAAREQEDGGQDVNDANDEQALAGGIGIETRPVPTSSAATTAPIVPKSQDKPPVPSHLGTLMEKSAYSESIYWGILYGYCMIVGLVGLISLLAKHWSMARRPFIAMTVTFSVMAFIILCGYGIFLEQITPKEFTNDRIKARQDALDGDALNLGFLGFALLGALYCDWTLGIMAGNLAGLPSKDNSGFYWTYFLFKRLTMLSS